MLSNRTNENGMNMTVWSSSLRCCFVQLAESQSPDQTNHVHPHPLVDEDRVPHNEGTPKHPKPTLFQTQLDLPHASNPEAPSLYKVQTWVESSPPTIHSRMLQNGRERGLNPKKPSVVGRPVGPVPQRTSPCGASVCRATPRPGGIPSSLLVGPHESVVVKTERLLVH